MDDFSDQETERFLQQIKSGIERRKSLVSSSEDIAGTPESFDGEWGEWMCAECGIFMKEHQRHCSRCHASRI